MKPVYCKTLLAFILAASAGTCLAGSGLRIICEGDANGAEVLIDGQFKGECPLDMQVPEGTLRLRVQKTVDAQHDPRVFEQEIRMGDGVMKRVEVHLGAAELNAEGKRRQQEQARQALDSIEAGMVAIPGKNYELGKYEVTQAQWKAIMGGNPSSFQKCADNSSTCGDRNPVERVSWDDVQEFIRKLNARTGKQYHLPTRDEWEYACHGGGKTEYCGGGNLDALGWYDENSGNVTHPVGQKLANGYGLHDMSGNVWEWVQTCEKIKISESYTSVKCGFMGGAFDSKPNRLNVSYDKEGIMWSRFTDAPSGRGGNIGFRLARTLP